MTTRTVLFSPATFYAFEGTDRRIIGFTSRWAKRAEALRVGDLLYCYATRLSRWVGVLEVRSEPFRSEEPLLAPHIDPFTIRVRVEPIVWLSLERGLPIQTDLLWPHLSFTKGRAFNETSWTGFLRSPLMQLPPKDAAVVHEALLVQSARQSLFPLTPKDQAHIRAVGSGSLTSRRCTPGSAAYWLNLRRDRVDTIGRLVDIGLLLGREVWLNRSVLEKARVAARDGRRGLVAFPDSISAQHSKFEVIWLKGDRPTHCFNIPEVESLSSPVPVIEHVSGVQYFRVEPAVEASAATSNSTRRAFEFIHVSYEQIHAVC